MALAKTHANFLRAVVGVEDSRVTCEELVAERTAAAWLNTDWLCPLFRVEQDEE